MGRGGGGVVVFDLADAEVDDLHEVGLAVLVDDEDVGRLHVAVDDAGRVGGLQGAEGLQGEMDGAHGLHAAAEALEELPEVEAVEELHDEVRGAVGQAADVVDLHDVVAVDLRRGDPLVHEALDRAVERHDGRAHELERHRRAPDEVRGLRDGAHPALAEERLDAVLPVEHVAGPWISVLVGGEGLRHGVRAAVA